MVGLNIVYALIDPRNGQLRYIGKSESGLERPREHGRPSTLRQNTNPHKCNWIRDLKRDGWEYEVEVLEDGPEDLNEAEIFWIGYFRMLGANLLNASTGGESGTKGWKQSPETIEKRRQKLLGHEVPQERRDRIAASLAGRPSPKKGRQLSEDELKKHAEAHAIPPFQDQHGRVYTTLKEAAQRWNIPPGNICNCLKGKRKSAGGLQFSYVDAALRPAAKPPRVLLTAEEKRAKNIARSAAWRREHPEYSSTEAVRAWRQRQEGVISPPEANIGIDSQPRRVDAGPALGVSVDFGHMTALMEPQLPAATPRDGVAPEASRVGPGHKEAEGQRYGEG